MRYLMTILLTGSISVCAEEVQKKAPDWHFSGSIVYSSRSLDGVIVSHTPINDGTYGNLVTTGDAMGVDDSQGAMLSLGVQYKRLVNFAVDMVGTTSEIAADVSLEGPFLGLTALY